MNPRVRIIVPAAVVSLLALTALPAAGTESNRDDSSLNKINHIVVIYEENHSFDNLNGGQQNRYTAGSDAVGLTQGYYNTQSLPIYQYLHEEDHPHYAIADNFFQAAFGGSFLNHQWLIAAATPPWPGEPPNTHAVVDSNGMPNNYPLYHATGPVSDPAGTRLCPVA